MITVIRERCKDHKVDSTRVCDDVLHDWPATYLTAEALIVLTFTIIRYVCPTEIIAFGDRIEEFDAMNTAVLAASCDSLWSHLAWVNMPRSEGGLGPMKIPICKMTWRLQISSEKDTFDRTLYGKYWLSTAYSAHCGPRSTISSYILLCFPLLPRDI